MYCMVLYLYYICCMKNEKTYSQMRKGVLELCILSIISDAEVYTSDIISTLKKADLLVVEGTLYPLLTRLKNENLLNYRWEESSGGPPRKYYSLTENGKSELNELKNAWSDLNKSINQIIFKTI